ncbi:MAG TPA: tetratricopeptide repeat protein [Steroidobacteraceae bacterium]|nr:tetratricopeptide repeat protein [Steroidobacteraceae bacterium]
MSQLQRFAATAAALALAGLAGCRTAPPATAEHPPAHAAHTVQDTNALTVMAEVALEKGDCRAAAEDYANAASGGTVNLARRASEVALECQDIPAAWSAAERWRALAPSDRDASLVYGTVALTLYHIGQARDALTPILKEGGPKADRDALSIIQLLSDDPDIGATPTLAALDNTVDPHSSSLLVLTAFGALALEAYDFNLAVLRAHQVLARDATSGSALRLLARTLVLQGNADGAIAVARQAMRADPSGSAFELADAYIGLDRLEEARQELERLRATDVSGGEIDRRLALLAYQSGDIADARRRFNALIDRGEAGESALLYLGDIAARSGDVDGALTDYRQLSDTPMALTARTRAAGILLDRGKRGEALDLLDSYESEHPEEGISVALAKADLLADHGDAQGGLSFIATALQQYPAHPRLEYERATLLERAGHVEESVAAFEQLLHQRPGDPTLMNALGYTLADHGLQLGRAESLIRRALAATPDHPAVLDSLGWVRLRRGDVRGALPPLERAYLISHDAQIAAHLGEALWMSGEQTQARKVWADALARNPDTEGLRALKDTVHRLVRPGTG